MSGNGTPLAGGKPPQGQGSRRFLKTSSVNLGTLEGLELVRDAEYDDDVVVKSIPREKLHRYGDLELEIRNHRRLDHPLVISFREVYYTETHLKVVLDLGGSISNTGHVEQATDLYAYVTSRPGSFLPEDEARWFFQQLAVAVQYCRVMDCPNRSIKMRNTLVWQDAAGVLRLCLCDFRYLHESRQQGDSSDFDPWYLPPEALDPRTVSIDGEKADAWVCGVMLFVMVVGRFPHDSVGLEHNPRQRVVEMLQRLGTGSWTMPDSLPAQLRDLLLRLLASDPMSRCTLTQAMRHPWFWKTLDMALMERMLGAEELVAIEAADRARRLPHSGQPSTQQPRPQQDEERQQQEEEEQEEEEEERFRCLPGLLEEELRGGPEAHAAALGGELQRRRRGRRRQPDEEVRERIRMAKDLPTSRLQRHPLDLITEAASTGGELELDMPQSPRTAARMREQARLQRASAGSARGQSAAAGPLERVSYDGLQRQGLPGSGLLLTEAGSPPMGSPLAAPLAAQMLSGSAPGSGALPGSSTHLGSGGRPGSGALPGSSTHLGSGALPGSGTLASGSSSHSLLQMLGWDEYIVPKDAVEEICEIGCGSFGVVSLARLHGSKVAVKKLQRPIPAVFSGTRSLLGEDAEAQALQQDSMLMEELAKEVQVLSSIRSPNVVQFLGILLDPPSIITEYCENRSLFDVLKQTRGSLPWRVRVSMALDAACGMCALHSCRQRGIVHRDLKSPNLLVTDNFRVKVGDFNLSRFAMNSETSAAQGFKLAECSSSGATNATWQAPEIIKEQPTYSTKSDVYAFGIIMWELLTCKFPWEGLGPAQVWWRVASMDERPSVPEDLSQLPGAPLQGVERFVQLMRECWQLDAAARPDFEHVSMVLQELLQELPPAPPAGRGAAAAARGGLSAAMQGQAAPAPAATWRVDLQPGEPGRAALQNRSPFVTTDSQISSCSLEEMTAHARRLMRPAAADAAAAAAAAADVAIGPPSMRLHLADPDASEAADLLWEQLKMDGARERGEGML